MKAYHNSPLLYERGFSRLYNLTGDAARGQAFYGFDYDARNKAVNMEFQHFHLFYEMMILLSPKAYHLVEGKRYDLVANDIVLLAPSVLHKTEYPPGAPSDRIILTFMLPEPPPGVAVSYADLLSTFTADDPVLRFHREEQKMVFRSLNDIARLSQTDESESTRNLMVHIKFLDFLYELYALKPKSHYLLNVEDDSKGKMYTIANYIHTHYSENISLNTLSEIFYINCYYLSHLFKKVTGYTVVQYIQLTRIKNAQCLLLDTNRKITDIAEATGFPSFSQFNRVFHKFCAMSPTEYRATTNQPLLPNGRY